MTNSAKHLSELCRKERVFSFIDVETTGLSVESNDRICEIAVLKYFPDGETRHWQTLVNPCRPISQGASMVNNISNEMVASAPKFKQVARTFLDFIEGTTIVCHNARFDMCFIQAELKKCSLCLPDMPVLDTLKIAREHFSFPSNSLGKIADFLAISTTQNHRALSDVHTTHMIFKHFVKELDKKGIELNQLTKSCLVY